MPRSYEHRAGDEVCFGVGQIHALAAWPAKVFSLSTASRSDFALMVQTQGFKLEFGIQIHTHLYKTLGRMITGDRKGNYKEPENDKGPRRYRRNHLFQ